MKRIHLLTLLFSLLQIGGLFGQETKQFLGIQAPKTALLAPVVFDHQDKTVLFGLYARDGRRDVSALQWNNGKWQPLGKNGKAITGVGGNFLADFVFDKNGVPWILTYYTKPSNPLRSDCFFLYTLKNDEWKLAGPKGGLKANYSGSTNLFFSKDRLFLTYRTWDVKTRKDRKRVFVKTGERWVENFTIADLLPKNSEIHSQKDGAFVVAKEDSKIKFFEFPDTKSTSLGKARFEIKLPAEHKFGRVFFRDGKPEAVTLSKGETSSVLFQCVTRGQQIELKKLPPIDKHIIVGVRWRFKDAMLAATTDFETARVYQLKRNGTWKLVAKHKESTGAVLYSPSFTLLGSGKPVVTWEEFYPR